MYHLSHRNSGIRGGRFLEFTKVPKPGSSTDNPDYYGPQDFAFGAVIEIFKHKFIINDVDEYTLKYMAARPDEYSAEVMESLKMKEPLKPPTSTAP